MTTTLTATSPIITRQPHIKSLTVFTPNGRRRIRKLLGIDPTHRFPTEADAFLARDKAARRTLGDLSSAAAHRVQL